MSTPNNSRDNTRTRTARRATLTRRRARGLKHSQPVTASGRPRFA